jgi:hypothetical protein
MADAQLKFETVLVCDDIRFEFNGKAILIGVYPTVIEVASFPVQFGISIFAVGEVIVGGQLSAPLRISDETGAVLFRSEDMMPTPKIEFKEGPFAMQANGFVAVNKESTLIFSFIINNIETIVLKKRVAISPGLIAIPRGRPHV